MMGILNKVILMVLEKLNIKMENNTLVDGKMARKKGKGFGFHLTDQAMKENGKAVCLMAEELLSMKMVQNWKLTFFKVK